MAEDPPADGVHPFRQYVDDFLSTATPGLEEVINSKSFGTMLAQTAGNLVALQRIGNEMTDLALRNARIASRADVTSLHRQLARSEDKLEMVLETVERLEDDLAAERRRNAEPVDSTSEDTRSSKPTGQPSPKASPRRTTDRGE